MKILVVDDQKSNQLMLAGLLSRMGHQVVCADNGQQALEQFDHVQPEIVLLDVMMPVMNGFEAAPKLKQLSGNVHLPIIFITALDAQDTLLKCLQAGGDDFLSIPFEPVVLKAKINAHARVRELSYSLAEKNKKLNWHSNRVEREQTVVRHMLSNALKENELEQPFIQYLLRPASTFNGDLCLGKAGPFGNYYLFLGDFTGHGLAPATGTLPISQAFFGMASRGLSVGDMAREFNQRLINLLPDDMFCAALIIELSAGGERLSCWNGGIPDAYVVNQDGEVEQSIRSRHMALGILPESQFDAQIDHLLVTENQSLIAFTDGVVEVQKKNGQLLTESGFRKMLKEHWHDQAKTGFAQLSEQLLKLIDDDPEHDDISLLAMQFKRPQSQHVSTETTYNQLPFELKIKIGKREMSELDPIQRLVDSLGKIESIKAHKTTLYLLFAECFNNIVDHNVLGLESNVKALRGFEKYYNERQQRLEQMDNIAIEIHIQYAPQDKMMSFEIASNGDKPYRAEHARSDEQDGERLFGRGLQLVENFADAVEWRDNGERLFVRYDLSRPPA